MFQFDDVNLFSFLIKKFLTDLSYREGVFDVAIFLVILGLALAAYAEGAKGIRLFFQKTPRAFFPRPSPAKFLVGCIMGVIKIALTGILLAAIAARLISLF